jgi:hypothetical protein
MTNKEYKAEYREKNREKLKQYRAEYREKNREKLDKQNKEYREKNRILINEKSKNRREKNLEKRLEIERKYRIKNREKINEHNKKYREQNRGKIAEYFKKRRYSEPAFKAMYNISNIIRGSLKNQSTRKNTKTSNLLGCSAKEFASHIESLFEPWMNWDNWGKCTGKLQTTWHIDHIKPLSHFNLSDPEQQKIAFHYTNCRPLDSLVNVSEGNRR